MKKEVLFLQNNEPLHVEIIETKGEVKVFRSEAGHPVLFYGGFTGSEYVAPKIPKNKINEIGNALALIKAHYTGIFKKNAIEDFYPRIKAIVNRLYKGDYILFKWLKDHDDSQIVLNNADMFRRAVAEIKAGNKVLKKDKFDLEGAEDILAILS